MEHCKHFVVPVIFHINHSLSNMLGVGLHFLFLKFCRLDRYCSDQNCVVKPKQKHTAMHRSRTCNFSHWIHCIKILSLLKGTYQGRWHTNPRHKAHTLLLLKKIYGAIFNELILSAEMPGNGKGTIHYELTSGVGISPRIASNTTGSPCCLNRNSTNENFLHQQVHPYMMNVWEILRFMTTDKKAMYLRNWKMYQQGIDGRRMRLIGKIDSRVRIIKYIRLKKIHTTQYLSCLYKNLVHKAYIWRPLF